VRSGTRAASGPPGPRCRRHPMGRVPQPTPEPSAGPGPGPPPPDGRCRQWRVPLVALEQLPQQDLEGPGVVRRVVDRDHRPLAVGDNPQQRPGLQGRRRQPGGGPPARPPGRPGAQGRGRAPRPCSRAARRQASPGRRLAGQAGPRPCQAARPETPAAARDRQRARSAAHRRSRSRTTRSLVEPGRPPPPGPPPGRVAARSLCPAPASGPRRHSPSRGLSCRQSRSWRPPGCSRAPIRRSMPTDHATPSRCQTTPLLALRVTPAG
jgi:hypothetical protein